MKDVWGFLRANLLSRRVWDAYDAILDAPQSAWDQVMQMSDRIASITRHPCAIPVTE